MATSKSIAVVLMHYTTMSFDINSKSFQTKTQILTQCIGRHVVGIASKT